MVYWAKEYNVNPRDLQLVMRGAIIIAGAVFAAYKKRFTITCTGSGDHTLYSLHAFGFAFDVRTRHLSLVQKKQIYNDIAKKFAGTGYQIIMESDHYHIEYDPEDWKESFNAVKL